MMRKDRLLLLAIAGLTPSMTFGEELPDPLRAGWNGEQVCQKLHEDDELRLLRCVFPPGGGHERHYHSRHVGYVLTGGKMMITDAEGTREVDVPTGSTFSSSGIDWHEVVNIGDTTSTYLIIEPR
jgi:quercetin dioxygenase-like cupin family protein